MAMKQMLGKRLTKLWRDRAGGVFVYQRTTTQCFIM
jgi:hypothetical protein